MITLDEEGNVITDPDLTLGYVETQVVRVHFSYVITHEEAGHYNTVKEYPNGGKDVEWVVDSPEEGYWEVTDPAGNIVKNYDKDIPDTTDRVFPPDSNWEYQIYHPYSEEEILVKQEEAVQLSVATARSLQTPVALMMFVQSANLPDSQALEVSNFYEDWSPDSIAYSKGDLRRQGTELYRCLQDHTSQPTWTPENAVSLWAHIVPPGEIQEWRQPDSTNPYMKGDKVIFKGVTYESTIDNNVWAPNVTGWSKV